MWKFQEFLNQNLAICLVMAVGAASVLRGGALLQMLLQGGLVGGQGQDAVLQCRTGP